MNACGDITRAEKRLYNICAEITHLKKKLFELWQDRGKVDQDVLDLAQKVDNLLNEYDRLLLNKESNTIQLLTMLLEMKDKQLIDHSIRLQKIVISIGEVFNLPELTMGNLLLLAWFHDIGKLGIPDYILFKPGPLSEDEYIKMKQHSELGCRIAKTADELINIADLILKHHEWWNGAGYPLGLKGEEIPLECRIIAIVDAFDAMTHFRPYQNSLTRKEAIDELSNCAGIQFDPIMVEMVISALPNFDGPFSELKLEVSG